MKHFLSFSLHSVLCLVILFSIMTYDIATASADRKTFDFVIGVNGDFKAAVSAASAAASSGKRFYIFFPDGEYNIGSLTGNSNQMTTFSTSNVSFIGQSADKTVIYNKSTQEGISVTATLYFNKANSLYLQDLTILNKACYGNSSTYGTTSRHVAVMEQGNDIVYKNVKLLSTQDTYYTKGARTYWENGEIHGTTDFICGGGDVLFNKCLIYIDKVSYLTAPATSTSWGYVFLDCTIDGSVNSYMLGRAWNGTPKCVYINTTMKKLPTAAAWGDPMNVVPSLFAEYNSKDASGKAVDLSGRRTTYTLNGTTTKLNPVLTADQAAKYTIDNIMGTWKPSLLTAQVKAPVAVQDGNLLKWDDNADALCWVVFKNNKFYKCVTVNNCEIPLESASYTVRAANEMGGLGAASNTVTSTPTALKHLQSDIENRSAAVFTISRGRTLDVNIPSDISGAKLLIFSANGKVISEKPLVNNHNEFSLKAFAAGTYLCQIVSGDIISNKKQVLFSHSINIYN